MAVSLKKEPMMREYTPTHLLAEEETIPPKIETYTPTHVIAEQIPETPITVASDKIEVIAKDLATLSDEELCRMTHDITNNVTKLFSDIEQITVEAKRRAADSNYWTAEYYGDMDHFYSRIGKKISKAYRKHARKKRIWTFASNVIDKLEESFPVIKILILGTILWSLIRFGPDIVNAMCTLLNNITSAFT